MTGDGEGKLFLLVSTVFYPYEMDKREGWTFICCITAA
jgi:hypothetical protein